MPTFIYIFSFFLLAEARYFQEKDNAVSLENAGEDKECASEPRSMNRGQCKEPEVIISIILKYHIFLHQGKVGDNLILKCQEYNCRRIRISRKRRPKFINSWIPLHKNNTIIPIW